MSKYKSTQEKTQNFFRTVQAGDIALLNLFQDAIAVFGFTKAGKTSSCHILANSPLKAVQENGELIYKCATKKYGAAIIGNTNESETQIPNIFQTKYKDSNGKLQQIVLLDQPGYGDGYGFHRIFSNGYFHYRTFSKTPRLKFMLAFKKVDLEGTAQKFKSTISFFFKTFKQYPRIKDSILKATVFLVTQADPANTIQNIKKTMAALSKASTSSFTEEERRDFQEMIGHMLQKDKVFMIKKPQSANIQTRETDILRQIAQKTTFWERKVTNNVVDMSQINFSVAYEILTPYTALNGNQMFKQDFNHFKDYMNQRIKDILYVHKFSFASIVDLLAFDAVDSIESHNFLEGMTKFIQVFYKFNDQYREKRQKTERTLFALNELKDDWEESRIGLLNYNEAKLKEKAQREKEMKSMYFIRKFKVLELINKMVQDISEVPLDRNIQWLQSISLFFIEIFRKFNSIRVERNDSEQIIYKYSYAVQRLFEESKITTLILFTNKQVCKKFDQIQAAMIDIFRPLRDHIFIRFQNINISELKEQFIKKLDFDSFELVNSEIISFLQSVPYIDTLIIVKIAKLVLRYADSVEKKKKYATNQQRKFVVMKLFEYHNKFYNYLQNLEKEKGARQERQKCVQIIVKLTKSLGHHLLAFPYFPEARQVFKSINNAQLVFKAYQSQLKVCQMNGKGFRSLLIEYGNYASECHRRELALKCYQEAHNSSDTYKELEQVSELIVSLETNKRTEDAYLKKLNSKTFCQDFSQSLKAKLGLIAKQQPFVAPP